MSRPIVFAFGVLGAACTVAVSFPTSFEQLKEAASQNAADPPASATRLSAPSGGPQTVRLAADLAGHFRADLRVNGASIAAMVDTGASLVALTAEDAARAGVMPDPRRLMRMSTANGQVTASLVMLHEVRLGDIVLRDVEAVINPPGTLRQTLLGMTFLNRLARFEMAAGRLNLTQ